MCRTLLSVVVSVFLLIAGCDQPQPTPQVQPKPEAKPVAAAAVPQIPAAVSQPATPPPPAVVSREAPGTTPASPVARPAETPAKPAVKIPNVPDVLTLAASQGEVTLHHLVHAQRFPCATCHGDGIPGKLDLTKDTAHELCRDCHKARGTGPTACDGCHKK